MATRNVYIWGTGKMASELIRCRYNELIECNVRGFIDNNKEKWGGKIDCWPIFPPDVLKDCDENTDLCICNSFESEIKDQIMTSFPLFHGRIFNRYYFEKIAIIQRYLESDDIEIMKILDYLNDNDLEYFNYEFKMKYSDNDCEVFWDIEKELYYVLLDGKKMYFCKRFKDIKSVQQYYNSLMIEQDYESPHRYLTRDFEIENGDVVVDAGAAEGMFSLSIIDKVSKVYLFEPDEEWVYALSCTFEPYKDRVTIVNKGISNYESCNVTTLDSYLNGETIDFIKMDIEGEEYYALLGSEKILRNSLNIKCVVCTYHQEFAYDAISKYLIDRDFSIEHSKGYMWFDERNIKYRPYVLRRGLVRARKQI